MKTHRTLLNTAVIALASLFVAASCGPGESESPNKEITSFAFLAADNAALSADVAGAISGSGISVTVPHDTDVSALVPTVSFTGVSLSPDSGVAQDFANPVAYTVTAADGSTQVYTVTVSLVPNSSKSITQFSIQGVDGVISASSISVTLPFGTDVTALTPTIAITGASVSPASGVEQDFTDPVDYTVTAADSTTKVYTVTVSVASNSAKQITQFSILGVDGDISASSISVTLPFGTDVTALTPTIAITGASVSPASGVQQDFTAPVDYTVTAADSSTKVYTVTVTVASNSANRITRFVILGMEGLIGASTITLTVPFDTDVTALTPTITITGASVSPASGVLQDFTDPVDYTVTAADSTTKVYTVSVTVATQDAKDISRFTLLDLGTRSTIVGTDISLIVPMGTDVTELTPLVTITGASVSPASGVVQDFTNPVDYTVTAADSTTKVYTATVTVSTSSLLPVSLGLAGSFAILAKSAISNVPTSAVTGDMGISPAAATLITGFSLIADSSNEFSTSPQVTGKIYAADHAPPTPSNLTTAVSDMMLAFTDAAGRAPDFTELGAGDVGGMTLDAGVYQWGTGLLIPSDITLDGSATDVWIFQIAQDLTVSNGVQVTLTGGALPKNIFWQVAGTVALGTTTHFEGIILSQTAIALETGASINGRLLAQTAVSIDGSTVVEPAP